MINWINFLHLYQPPRQNEFIFHKVARESYAEIARFFDLYDGIRLTMNISGSLLEQLVEYRYEKLLEDFAGAFLNGEIELTGSAMYHPILPLLSEDEIERQILLDEKIKKQIFGNRYARCGFYLPEMAYSRKVAEVLERMGFEWIILDEISFGGRLGVCDKQKVYRIKGLKLKTVFRDREISNQFVPERINEISLYTKGENKSIITATDGELYGHHHQDFYNKTKEAFTDGNIKSLKVSEFIRQAAADGLEEIEPLDSNWESSEEELAQGIAFSYWNFPGNEIQEKLWDFANFSMREVEAHEADANYEIARALLDKGLASCHFWAASGRKSKIWKDTIWNPDMIENGNAFFAKAMRSIQNMDKAKRMEAEEKFLEITKLVWHAHWNKFYEI